MTEAVFVALVLNHDMYEVILMDEDGNRIGHGYRGPSKSRADQDLKYWLTTKGLARADPTDA